MTQISRPFQIVLAAGVLFAAVWFIALRGHSSGGESTSSAPAVSAPAASSSGSSSPSSAAGQSSPGGGTKASQGQTYHGSAPGVAGLTRAIAKAQGAVKEYERSATRSAGASAQSQSSSAASSAPATKPTTPSTVSVAKPHAAEDPKTVASATSKQTLVEGELKQGRTVIVLFWSPKGAVDNVVHGQLALLQAFHAKHGLEQNEDIAVHYSSAAEVGQYGTITGSLQVLQTPTLLVIGPSGKTKTLTGLVDAYAIQQAIKEARRS